MFADIAAIPATYSADDSKSHAGFSTAMGLRCPSSLPHPLLIHTTTVFRTYFPDDFKI